jgi:hypothetical protein
MLDVENMSLDELLTKEREYGAKAYEYRALAQACCNERVRRSTLVMMATAKAAQERARTGVCTRGVGDCPVHQMGSCQYIDPDYVEEILDAGI